MGDRRIPEGWRECRLGEFIRIKHGYPFSGGKITDDDTGKILVTPGNFHIGGGFKSDKFKFYKGEYPKEYEFKGGEIIVTMTDLSKDTDALGYAAKVPMNDNYIYLHNQRVGLVEFISDFIERDFIYWLMRTYDYHWFIVGSASGTSIMHTSPTRIIEYIFKRPPLPEQRAIASVLSSLDDKIDLLNRENQTLEQMAEALFRQWFIEEADEDWEEGRLGDVLAVIESGKRPKGGINPDLENGIPSIGAENINGIGHYDYSKTKFVNEDFFRSMKKGIIKDYDVLIYKDGAYIGRKGMFGLKYPYDICTVNEHVFILRANDKLNQFFLYFILQQEALVQLNTNSAQPGLNQEAIKSLEITIPLKQLVEKFGDIVKPFIDRIFINAKQIRTLEKLRDTLLPKLMSGEVRVRFTDSEVQK